LGLVVACVGAYPELIDVPVLGEKTCELAPGRLVTGVGKSPQDTDGLVRESLVPEQVR
jgi:hypothetical protein